MRRTFFSAHDLLIYSVIKLRPNTKPLPKALQAEIQRNLDALRADLAMPSSDEAAGQPLEEKYQFAEYENFAALGETPELLGAFYRSLTVLSEGHAGLIDADPDSLEMSYRIIIESAIQLGEDLLQQRDQPRPNSE